MDEFALNGAAINGEANELVMLEGVVAFDLDCELGGIRGATLTGAADIELDVSGDFYNGLIGTGSIDIEMEAELAPSLLTMITGEIAIDMQAQMIGAAGIMGAGSIPILFEPDLWLTKRAMAQGDITIAFGLTGDGRIVQRVQIDGWCAIIVDPLYLDGRRTPAIRPDMPLDMDAKITGPASLEMRGQGAADIDVVLDGVTRLGGKVNIEGSTSIELITHGAARQFTLIPIDGIADIQFLLVSERAGRPAIPTEYEPAPAGRRFVVARQSRERRVVYDRVL